MDSLVSFSSKDIDFSACVLCEKTKSDRLCAVEDKGLSRLSEVTHLRKILQDKKWASVILKVENILQSDVAKNLKYHKSCYSDYTNKTMIERLRKKSTHVAADSGNVATVDRESRKCLRQQGSNVPDCKLCIFCQSERKERSKQIMSFNMENKIKQLAKVNYELGLNIAGVSDLIASEARYHSSCLLKNQQNAKKFECLPSEVTRNAAFTQICFELTSAANKGHVSRLWRN